MEGAAQGDDREARARRLRVVRAPGRRGLARRGIEPVAQPRGLGVELALAVEPGGERGGGRRSRERRQGLERQGGDAQEDERLAARVGRRRRVAPRRIGGQTGPPPSCSSRCM
ncbi:MAG TPA: hypothetical protein VIH93_00270 [Thermoanaerobaculia bacterium]